jgi:hypothetical protein
MYPLDLVTAQQWAHANPGAPDAWIDAQPWDPSVRILVRYPTVLDQLASNVAWTQAIGTAFHDQPQAVMNSIQRLRAQAQAMGNLYSTPQALVTTVDGQILILPTSPQLVYVPVYNPQWVYFRRHTYVVTDPYVTYSVGFRVGTWLDFGFDWSDHVVVRDVRWYRVGERHDIRPAHDAPRYIPRPDRPPQVGHVDVRGPERAPDRAIPADRREAPRDAPHEAPRETPHETPRETPHDIPKETPHDAPKDVPHDTPKDVPHDAPKAPPHDVPHDKPAGAPGKGTPADPRNPGGAPGGPPGPGH